MLRRIGIPLALVLVVAGITAIPTFSKSSSPAHLQDAGWACPVVFEAVHCLPPGTSVKDGASPSLTALVFAGTNPDATEATFLGTEHLIRADVFERGGNNQPPCPQDPPTFQYKDLRTTTELPIPYYACHHYNSSF
jgi:hypothetical protein